MAQPFYIMDTFELKFLTPFDLRRQNEKKFQHSLVVGITQSTLLMTLHHVVFGIFLGKIILIRSTNLRKYSPNTHTLYQHTFTIHTNTPKQILT